jgi:hypothetical protein
LRSTPRTRSVTSEMSSAGGGAVGSTAAMQRKAVECKEAAGVQVNRGRRRAAGRAAATRTRLHTTERTAERTARRRRADMTVERRGGGWIGVERRTGDRSESAESGIQRQSGSEICGRPARANAPYAPASSADLDAPLCHDPAGCSCRRRASRSSMAGAAEVVCAASRWRARAGSSAQRSLRTLLNSPTAHATAAAAACSRC